MEALLGDAEELVADWPVWSIVSQDPTARELVLHRSDEDQATVRVRVAASYPRGTVTVCMLPLEMYPSIVTQDSVRLSEALDNALMQWAENEGDMSMPQTSGMEMVAPEIAAQIEHVDPGLLLEAEKRMERDVADPRMEGLAFGFYDANRTHFFIRIGVSLAGMDTFRARSLHLDRQKCVVVELHWVWSYMRDAESDMPKVHDVFMCRAAALSSREEVQDKQSIGPLRWFLSNRIGNALRKNHIVRDRALSGIVDVEGQEVEGLSNWKFCESESFYERGNANILLGIRRLLQHRLEHCTKVCLICDDLLPLDGMKTSVCDKPLCRHGLENYGLGTDVYSELAQPEVTELLITLTCAAACLGRSRDAFTPMCPVLLDEGRLPGYKGPLHFFQGAYGSTTKNFDLIVSTVQKIPKVSALKAMSSTEGIRKQLQQIDPLLFPLLQWILSSNRTHLEPINPKFHLKGLGKYQFHLISSSPEKELVFRNKRAVAASKKLGKKGSGSFWAWHGSQPGNWHCILRSGLKNYSNTKFMSAGAAYGPGIYTAKNISTSLGYMGAAMGGWKGAEYLPHTNGLMVIALCEIADDKDGYKDVGNNIVTIQDESIICTRFLFAFPDGFNGDSNLHTDSLEIPDGALNAL